MFSTKLVTPTTRADLSRIGSRRYFNLAPGEILASCRSADASADTGLDAIFGGGGDYSDSENLRKGLDSLDIGNGTSDCRMLVLSRAIRNRVSIGVRTSATAEQTGVSADVDVTKHVRVQSDVRSNGSNAGGVGTRPKY